MLQREQQTQLSALQAQLTAQTQKSEYLEAAIRQTSEESTESCNESSAALADEERRLPSEAAELVHLEELVESYRSENCSLQHKLSLLNALRIEEDTKFSTELRTLQEQLRVQDEWKLWVTKEHARDKELLQEATEQLVQLRESQFALEEQCQLLKLENTQLQRNLTNSAACVAALETELATGPEQANANHENLQQELRTATTHAKQLELRVRSLTDEQEGLREQLTSSTAALTKRLEHSEKERRLLLTKVHDIKNENCQLHDSIARIETAHIKAKEDLHSDFQQRLLALKQEKAELESTVQELSDQIDVNRNSLLEANLFDELAQLGETQLSRKNTPRKSEPFRRFDFSETNKAEQDTLAKELAELRGVAGEAKIARAECSRLETELVLSQKHAVELLAQLEETEQLLIHSKIEHAEAATDRDVYHKLFLDLKKSLK